MKTVALIAFAAIVGAAAAEPLNAQIGRGRATGTTSGSSGRIGSSAGTTGRSATVRGSTANVTRGRADNSSARGTSRIGGSRIGSGTSVGVRSGSGRDVVVRPGSGSTRQSAPLVIRGGSSDRRATGSIGGGNGRATGSIGGGSGRATGSIGGDRRATGSIGRDDGRATGTLGGNTGRDTGPASTRGPLIIRGDDAGRATGSIGDGTTRGRSGIQPAIGYGYGTRGSSRDDGWRYGYGRRWRPGVLVVPRSRWHWAPWGAPLVRSCWFSIGTHTGFGCVNLFPAATLLLPWVLYFPPQVIHVHTTSHSTSSYSSAPYVSTPQVENVTDVDDASCAVVSVLLPGNDGYWKTLRLPAAGAATRDELRRVVTDRLADGQPFRITGADGVSVDVPAAAQVDRVVIDACR